MSLDVRNEGAVQTFNARVGSAQRSTGRRNATGLRIRKFMVDPRLLTHTKRVMKPNQEQAMSNPPPKVGHRRQQAIEYE